MSSSNAPGIRDKIAKRVTELRALCDRLLAEG